jgi:hypothetical protein
MYICMYEAMNKIDDDDDDEEDEEDKSNKGNVHIYI